MSGGSQELNPADALLTIKLTQTSIYMSKNVILKRVLTSKNALLLKIGVLLQRIYI